MLEARIAIYVTFATVVVGFVTAIVGLMRGNRKLEEIHILVNSNYAAITARVAQLVATLHDNGIEVPPPAAPNVPE